jgi:hypothetical protein
MAIRTKHTIEPNAFERESPERRIKTFQRMKWIILGLIVCVGIFYTIVLVKTKDLTKRLMVHHAISNGAIISGWEGGHRGGSPNLFYAYVINGKLYQKGRFTKKFGWRPGYMVHKFFPLAYEPGNPDNSFLLMTPEDFGYFDLPFPDSLRWISEYMR